MTKENNDVCILSPNEIDGEKVSYSSPNNFPGGKLVYVNYGNDHNEKVSLIIKSPGLLSEKGLKVWDGGNGDLIVNIPSKSSNQMTNDFRSAIQGLDEKLLLDAGRYSNEWFKKKLKDAELLDNMNKSIRGLTNPSANQIRLKLQKKNGEWVSQIFDQEKNMSTPEKELIPGCTVNGLIHCYAVHINKDGKYGYLWRLLQAKVLPPQNIPSGKCMLIDSSDESDGSNSE